MFHTSDIYPIMIEGNRVPNGPDSQPIFKIIINTFKIQTIVLIVLSSRYALKDNNPRRGYDVFNPRHTNSHLSACR